MVVVDAGLGWKEGEGSALGLQSYPIYKIDFDFKMSIEL